jgi:hypothetical protein
MERFFQILAVILAGIAAYFLWQGNNDGAYVSAVLGAVSFFLSIRFQVKGRLQQRERERLEEEERLEIEAPESHSGELNAETDFAIREETKKSDKVL